ncbi:MAG: hypothetical protein KatS3mg077_2572 [Candidatus Binatia bacterium]|nr:MAG: hypothetical protein KatS3mg077_2572 [Candidatus Binatia bacterium]
MPGAKRTRTVVVLLILMLAPPSIRATTVIYENDTELALQSQAVVLGKVVRVVPEYVAERKGVRTRVTIAVQARVAGRVRGQTIELTELGGELPGLTEKVFGTPNYRVGERVLVFLQRDRRGGLHTTGLSLGKYSVEAGSSGLWVARRDSGDARVLRPRSHRLEAATVPAVRPLSDVIAEAQNAFAARGQAPPPVDIAPPAEEDFEVSAPFTLLGNGRWFQPDTGTPVSFSWDARGLAILGPAATQEAILAAMGAWNAVAGSHLVLDLASPMEPQPFKGCAGQTGITFDDPFQEIANPTDCRGILAVGGYCSGNATTVRNGMAFGPIQVGKVLFNDGWDGCPIWNRCNVEEVATHELGHAIGLGHSSDSQATMSAFANFDGRCAALTTDDIEGLLFLYGDAGPDLVMLPRSPVNLRVPAGTTALTKHIALQVRNSDKLGSTADTPTAQLVVNDGTCPAGTVQSVDTDPRTPGNQDTLKLGPGQSAKVQVVVNVNSADVTSPLARAPQRCMLNASVNPTDSSTGDRQPNNNQVPIVLDIRDDNDLALARLQSVQETALGPVAPVRIVLPRAMPSQERSVRFRVQNLDLGTKEARSVTVSVDPGDCPAGLVAGLDVAPQIPGDQTSAEVLPGGVVTGRLLLAPPSGLIVTPNRSSPARCTVWLRVAPAPGETDLSNNVTPVVVDVVDLTDAL